jgi:Phage tail tube protein
MAFAKFGITQIHINGKAYALSDGDLTIMSGGFEREAINSNSGGTVGYSEKPKTAEIEIEFIKTSDVTIDEFKAMDNVTLRAETLDGRSYTMASAVCASAPEFTTTTGKLKVKFFGPKFEER